VGLPTLVWAGLDFPGQASKAEHDSVVPFFLLSALFLVFLFSGQLRKRSNEGMFMHERTV
jgi:uncharacterized membrane protein YtjA (UPF0391 family)